MPREAVREAAGSSPAALEGYFSRALGDEKRHPTSIPTTSSSSDTSPNFLPTARSSLPARLRAAFFARHSAGQTASAGSFGRSDGLCSFIPGKTGHDPAIWDAGRVTRPEDHGTVYAQVIPGQSRVLISLSLGAPTPLYHRGRFLAGKLVPRPWPCRGPGRVTSASLARIRPWPFRGPAVLSRFGIVW